MKMNINDIYLYKWGKLFFIEFENNIGFSALKEISLNQEKSLKSSRIEFVKKIQKDETFNYLNIVDYNSYYKQLYELDERILKEIEHLQRYSMVLSVFSFFEGQLKSLCYVIESDFDFKIKIKDLNRNDNLMMYWNYLVKVFGINPKKVEPFYTPIKQQKTVRNIISHQSGVVNQDQLKKIVNTTGLELEENQIIISSNIYLEFLIEIMINFYKHLLLDIDLRFKMLEKD